MKTISLMTLAIMVSWSFSSCKKEACAECHYDLNSAETVEIGEKCGDDLSSVESNGIAVGDTIYEVHCHEH